MANGEGKRRFKYEDSPESLLLWTVCRIFASTRLKQALQQPTVPARAHNHITQEKTYQTNKMEKIINDANFAELESAGLPYVRDFSATWCGPCKKIAPIIKELAEEYDGRINVGLCDVDECEELTGKYGIRNVPTVIFIKNGEIVNKQVGAARKDVFAELFESLL